MRRNNILGYREREDMQGVDTTGIEEIVGAARRGRAIIRRRRPTFPPMPRQSVPGVAVRKPRVEIVTMTDPLKVYSGPANQRTMSPSMAALLQMIRNAPFPR